MESRQNSEGSGRSQLTSPDRHDPDAVTGESADGHGCDGPCDGLVTEGRPCDRPVTWDGGGGKDERSCSRDGKFFFSSFLLFARPPGPPEASIRNEETPF